MSPYRLIIHDLSKAYGELAVLKRLSLTLESGHTYCLMGPSGCGKTTLLRLILGLEKPDAGSICTVSVSGPSSEEPYVSKHLVAVFQEDRLCEAFSPLENILLAAAGTLSRRQAHAELVRLLPEESISRPVSTLSGGMKRRTAILRALLAPSDGILMDEPFTGLDEATKHQVISYIKEKTEGKLLLLATHQEEDAALLEASILHPFS